MSPTAFQALCLDTQYVAQDQLAKLLVAKKPAALWAGLFALIEAGEDGTGYKNYKEATKHDNTEETQVPLWEAKILEATTPAKNSEWIKDKAMTLPAMVLKQITRQMEEGELKTTLQ
ncbi:hypothetical protein ACA910_002982 [Epithemia clementina (nom. ined.)]